MMKFKICIEKESNGRTCLLLNMLNCCLRKMSQKYKRLPQGISYTYLLPMRTIKRLAIIKKSENRYFIILSAMLSLMLVNTKHVKVIKLCI